MTHTAPSRRRTGLDGLILLLPLALYYGHPLLTPGVNFHGGDATLFFYPYQHLFRESAALGVLPLWNPYAGHGMPALAACQGGFLYPPHALFLAPLSIPLAARLLAFAHIWLQAFGMYGLARFGFGLRREAGLFAGLALGVCAFNAAHVEQFMIAGTASWSPLILWSWISFLRRPGLRPFLATVATLSAAILCGHAQYWIYTLDVMLLLALLPPLDGVARIGWRRRGGALAGLAAVGAFAFALTASQLIPTLELAERSERVIDPPEYSLHASFPPSCLLHYIMPERLPDWRDSNDIYRNPVEMACFLGRATIALAFLGLAVGWRRRTVRILALWAAIALFFAFGAYQPGEGALFQWATRLLPGWDGLRVPARLTFIAGMAIIGIAAVGLEWLAARLRRPAWATPLAILACASVMAEQAWVSFRLPLRHAARDVAVEPRASPADWFAQHPGEYNIFRLTDFVDIMRVDAVAGAVRAAALEPNTGIYRRIGTVNAFVEGLLPLLRTEDFLRAYRQNFYSPTPDADLLGLMSVRYIAADKPVSGDGWKAVASLPPLEPNRRPIVIHENLRWRPLAFWRENMGAAVDPASLDGTYESAGIPSPRAEAPRPLPRMDGKIGPPLTVRRLTPNRLAVENPEEAQGDVLFASSPYPGWKVHWPDGAMPLEPVNAIHSKFAAPPGARSLTLAFEPFSFRLGLFMTLNAMGAFLALWLTSARRDP